MPLEEDRIRPVYSVPSVPTVPTDVVYDYFIRDHLGNVRMVLTEEQKQDIILLPVSAFAGVTFSSESVDEKKPSNHYLVSMAIETNDISGFAPLFLFHRLAL